MHDIEQVVAKWRRDGLAVNSGASELELQCLQRRLGVPLPADVRFYFDLANGMGAGHDEYLVQFWSIEKILAEANGIVRDYPDLQPTDLPIADVLIESWFIVLRVGVAGEVGIFVEGNLLELPSLTEFFVAYRTNPRSVWLVK